MFGPVSSKVMYEQAIATLSFIEALVALGETGLEPMAEEAVQLIVRSQNSAQKSATLQGPTPADSPHYGGWRYEPSYTDADLSVSAWQVLALRAAVNGGFSVPERVFTDAAKYVRTLKGKPTARSATTAPADIGDSCARAGMGAFVLQLERLPQGPGLIAPAIRFMQDHAPAWNCEVPGERLSLLLLVLRHAGDVRGGRRRLAHLEGLDVPVPGRPSERGRELGREQAEENETLETYRTALRRADARVLLRPRAGLHVAGQAGHGSRRGSRSAWRRTAAKEAPARRSRSSWTRRTP
ncbi:MAG: hypothetical protein MZU91_10825 [Desulfosudis oleivorans]|nr:hypothetical protein [Desulfosudis oleivorans]